MSNDLISRSALLEHMGNWAFQECPVGICEPESDVYKTIKEAVNLVKEQPAAYDVDRVMEKIHNAGGCDGADGYDRGWDDAIAEAEKILEAEMKV